MFRFVFTPFYIFWDTFSFGSPNMEYRGFGTLCLGLYMNIRTVFNLIFDPNLSNAKANIIIGTSLVVIYLLYTSHVTRKWRSLYDRNKIAIVRRMIFCFVVIIYISISMYLFLNLGGT